VAWTLPKVPCVTYARNSLATVIVQLRYRPVLKIEQGTDLGAFQDRIRSRFSGYEKTINQNIEITPAGVNATTENAHRFPADGGEPTTVTVGPASFTIEYTKHHSRSVLVDDLRLVMSALEMVYAPIVPTRLGVRYINLIKKADIGKDLGRSLAWSDLLSEGFASVPGNLTKLDDDTLFVTEVDASHQRGRMTLRYGVMAELVPQGAAPPIRGPLHFRLDTDRYVDTAFKSSDVVPLATDFVQDIYDLFRKAAGPALLEWMTAGANP
jgi:uncharacterized protein (TIGR04255 family)